MRAWRSRVPDRKFAGPGNARFAVKPYPAEWVRHLVLKDGWRILTRPIRPEDEPLIHEFVKHVTMEDLRLRFLAPMKHFSHEFIARLTQLDYARAMAFVAFDEASGELAGVVRLHSDSIYETGEYAILLRSDLKGRGLGWALMQLLIEYAKSEGLKQIFGQVLRENTTMIEMCRSLGFKVEPDPTERDLFDVTLPLIARPAQSRATETTRNGCMRPSSLIETYSPGTKPLLGEMKAGFIGKIGVVLEGPCAAAPMHEMAMNGRRVPAAAAPRGRPRGAAARARRQYGHRHRAARRGHRRCRAHRPDGLPRARVRSGFA